MCRREGLGFSITYPAFGHCCRLANWGKATAVRFAPSGERFAAVGEGGVVATWRLDAPTRQVTASSVLLLPAKVPARSLQTPVTCLWWRRRCRSINEWALLQCAGLPTGMDMAVLSGGTRCALPKVLSNPVQSMSFTAV